MLLIVSFISALITPSALFYQSYRLLAFEEFGIKMTSVANFKVKATWLRWFQFSAGIDDRVDFSSHSAALCDELLKFHFLCSAFRPAASLMKYENYSFAVDKFLLVDFSFLQELFSCARKQR